MKWRRRRLPHHIVREVTAAEAPAVAQRGEDGSIVVDVDETLLGTARSEAIEAALQPFIDGRAGWLPLPLIGAAFEACRRRVKRNQKTASALAGVAATALVGTAALAATGTLTDRSRTPAAAAGQITVIQTLRVTPPPATVTATPEPPPSRDVTPTQEADRDRPAARGRGEQPAAGRPTAAAQDAQPSRPSPRASSRPSRPSASTRPPSRSAQPERTANRRPAVGGTAEEAQAMAADEPTTRARPTGGGSDSPPPTVEEPDRPDPEPTRQPEPDPEPDPGPDRDKGPLIDIRVDDCGDGIRVGDLLGVCL